VFERRTPDIRIWVSQRAVFVNLILKNVGIDGARPHRIFFRESFDLIDAVDSVWKIPQHVQCDSGAGARPAVDFARVAEFLLDGRCRGGLQKLAEPRSGVRKTPRWQLDPK
jgi:hypothetical protein